VVKARRRAPAGARSAQAPPNSTTATAAVGKLRPGVPSPSGGSVRLAARSSMPGLCPMSSAVPAAAGSSLTR
jgi:hypothetical protein